MNRRRKDQKREDEAEALAGDVHAAMSAMGWIVPQDEADVLRAEQHLAENPVALPEELRDPKAAFDRAERASEPAPAPIPFPENAEIDSTLARAAREAGHLSPEIEDRMRRDREAAERAMDADEDGEDDK